MYADGEILDKAPEDEISKFHILNAKNGDVWAVNKNSEIEILKEGVWHNFNELYEIEINTPSDILEDIYGNIWIGNYGQIFKYNGIDWKTYEHKIKNSTTNMKIIPNTFCSQKNGTIWVGSDRSLKIFGVDKFNNPIENEYISVYDLISKVVEDKNGVVWIGTRNKGLVKHNQGSFSAFFPNGLSNNKISNILEDGNKRVYFQASRMNRPIISFSQNNWSYCEFTSSEDMSFRTIFKDKTNRIWSLFNKGLSLLENNKFVEVLQPSSFGVYDGFTYLHAIDNSNNILLVTYTDELFSFDGNEWNPRMDRSRKKNTSISNGIISMMVSSNNEVFAGLSNNGIKRYDFSKGYFLPNVFDQSGSFSEILEDNKNNLWINGETFIIKYDYSHVEIIDVDVSKKGSPTIKDIYISNDGSLWAIISFDVLGARTYGLYRVNENILEEYELNCFKINSIVEDQTGGMIVATDNGLRFFDGEKFNEYSSNNGLAFNYTDKLMVDTENSLWVCHEYKGEVCKLKKMENPSYVFEWNQNKLNYIVELSFYLDIDKNGFDGSLIYSVDVKNSAKNSYELDLSGRESGDYYIYVEVVTDSGVNYYYYNCVINHNK